MKTLKILPVVLLLCSFGFISKTNAQIDVTVNPIGLLFGNLGVGGDFVLSDNMSVEATVGFGSGSTDLIDAKFKHLNIPITGVGKYYFGPDDGADKFYASVFLRFVSRNYSVEGDNSANYSEYSQTRFGGGFGVGWKAVSSGGFVFDIGLGAGRAFVDNINYKDSSGTQFEVDWGNLMIIGKLGVGYRFGG